MALERMREENVNKLFIKAFSNDGSWKTVLVDEKMTCGYVTRLLADKNHVTMEPKYAIVEQLPDLHMERVYEDHEMLVDNLMLWTREWKNKILFAERPEKNLLFQTPEKFLLSEDDRGWSSDHDDNLRQVIIDEFFGQSSTTPSISGHTVPPMEGFLYLKSDAKKGWKKYYFVLRPSGLYYVPKDKVKTLKELVCLTTFDNNEVYVGVNWKKKYKSPTDFCFAIKHPRLQQPKSVKFIKFLCADDQQTLDRWITAMRIAKHGRQLLENYRSLVEELTQEDLDHLAHARSCSISSIPTKTNNPPMVTNSVQPTSSNASVANSDISSGRHSRASSSSSSGCLSDGGTASESAFDCEFPMGTIKRKPSMKSNIPLTWMTRQLKEMAEKDESEGGDTSTLTRRPRQRDDTLKRHADTSESAVYSSSSMTSSSYVHDTGMFSSTLSLDSLPPPPPPLPADSVMAFPRPPSLARVNPVLSSLDSDKILREKAFGACLVELQKKLELCYERSSSMKKDNFADDLPTDKENKKITFNLTEAPPSPRKPLPPRRNESTRLSSTKKLADSNSNPPTEFFTDAQMKRKKWQVAQQCKIELLSDDYMEASERI
ncbi:abnormal cell migration protein 10-like [Pieris rapae]|uniref:abnormal cell migration protein 10-like n=1 Tax=Pieris rapae TaxID=64459 RepID=UPI001E27E978|nr:abnormal cell migration protein 10-like [Pieris rapae]